jgi:hypothetical protein
LAVFYFIYTNSVPQCGSGTSCSDLFVQHTVYWRMWQFCMQKRSVAESGS